MNRSFPLDFNASVFEVQLKFFSESIREKGKKIKHGSKDKKESVTDYEQIEFR